MLAKLEKAKAENKTLKVSYTTVLFSGSPGVGKTTLLNKLNKQPLIKHHHSTGIAKSKHAICVKTAAVTKELQWVVLDYDSMISHLNKHLHNVQFSSPRQTAPSSVKNIPNVTSTVQQPQHTLTRSKSELEEVDVAIATADSSNTPPMGDVWDIINFLDTGGQPEFVNLLPAVSSSIALTFIVFNLSKPLDSLVHVQHNVNGNPSFVPYNLDCTNLEFIKRLMVSSENFNKNTILLKSIQREDGGNDSKICYVGTHALNVNEREIQEVDVHLSNIASELRLHKRSFWSSPKQKLKRVFPIDMFPNGKDDETFEDIIEVIRDNIQKQVEKRDYYKVPITWFIFLLKMQKLCQMKQTSYITYQEAADVWMSDIVNQNKQEKQKAQHESVGRDNSDVHNILLFFHFMGMLFYYHKVEGICNFVFIDRQWLFEKLTELVEIKFTECYNKRAISAEDVKQFTMEGRLNSSIIKNLKVNLQDIEPMYFIHLLDHLNIIAPIDAHQKDYFMPCVLPSYSLTKSSLDLDKLYGYIQHVPLLAGFKNGPMPQGFFCQLIVELFRNLPKGWNFPLLSTSRAQHVYNNLITFHTSGHDVSLFYKIGYLEIQLRCKQSQPITIHLDVKCKLDKVLKKVCKHLQLDKEQVCYGFNCNCEGEIHHFAKLTSPTECTCGYSFTELTEHHKVWLPHVQVCSYIL